MSTNTLIKWPGGKSREIKYIENLVPEHRRYIEPFFGGGAMYFYLKPPRAIVNDISPDLTSFYSLVKAQNVEFKSYLCKYQNLSQELITVCEDFYEDILNVYQNMKMGNVDEDQINLLVSSVLSKIENLPCTSLVLNFDQFSNQMKISVKEKMRRTARNERIRSYSQFNLQENLITGFMSGLYVYFRGVYNDILLRRKKGLSIEYVIANFYFIREYCYGSMFRYNSEGEFNIPYGGMSYNRKNFGLKIDNMFSTETKNLFSGTDIHCQDFEDFFVSINLNKNDFMFLDPPYDTDFSDYEGKDFTKEDQRRLSKALKCTEAKFVMIIKNTDFIRSLYKNSFNVISFNKTYSYNVRSRNDRTVEHLIITNL